MRSEEGLVCAWLGGIKKFNNIDRGTEKSLKQNPATEKQTKKSYIENKKPPQLEGMELLLYSFLQIIFSCRPSHKSWEKMFSTEKLRFSYSKFSTKVKEKME